MDNTVQAYYGNRLRVRVCGLCLINDSILLVNHRGLSSGSIWIPPGGGIDFGESAADCLIREFAEETGLTIGINKFAFACEFIEKPLHAIELFFHVNIVSGQLKTGNDPEPGSPSTIQEVAFRTWNEVAAMPLEELHGIFKHIDHPAKITTLEGYFKL